MGCPIPFAVAGIPFIRGPNGEFLGRWDAPSFAGQLLLLRHDGSCVLTKVWTEAGRRYWRAIREVPVTYPMVIEMPEQ
jgi:hypothetical protein